jgi:hypothetical protein
MAARISTFEKPRSPTSFLTSKCMTNNGSGTSSWLTWLGIFTIAAVAVFFVMKQFFPQIIEEVAAGIVAFFVFLVGAIFRRKKS